MCQSLVISRTEWNWCWASQRPASSALERVSTDSLPRSTQHLISLRLPPSRAGKVGLGHRRIGAGDQQAFGLAVAKDIDRMFDPAASAGQNDGRVGRWRSCRRRFAEREGKEDEAEPVEQGNEGREARRS